MIEIIAVIFSLLSVYFTIKNKIVAWPIISYIGIDGKEHIYFIDFKIIIPILYILYSGSMNKTDTHKNSETRQIFLFYYRK